MKLKNFIFIAIFTSIICILSPISIYIGTIPITLAVFVVVLTGILFKWHESLLCVLLYLTIGLIGVPVFSGFTGGVGILIGITGGYLIGYIPLVIITSLFTHHYKKTYLWVIGIIIGLLFCYVFGCFWFMIQTDLNLWETLSLTVIPFIIPDIIKITIAIIIGTILIKRFNINYVREENNE